MKFLKHNLTPIVLVSVLVISIFTLFFAANITYRQIIARTESERQVVNSYRIYVELEQLSSNTKDAESSERAFLLTNDSSFLRSYFDALNKVENSFANLRLLTQENTKQVSRLDTLTTVINQRISYLTGVLSRNDIDLTTSDTLTNIILKGRELMALAQSNIDEMVTNELDLLENRELLHLNDITFPPFSIIFIVLFSLMVFIVSFFKINNDLKGLAITNNQLLINSEIFEHSEQIADLSYWYWDIKEDKLNFSNNLYRLLGCDPNEFEPSFENFLDFIHPDDRYLLLDGRHNAMKDILPSMIYFRVIRKDGVIRHFKSIGKQITDNYGTRFTIGINADITEQYSKAKFLEQKLEDLERSNKQLSAFNHIASHDLQEPLRKIQTFISRIREVDSATIPEKIVDYLSGVEKATGRMQKFILDLLLYSRANKADKRYERADLNELLEYSKRDLSQRIEEKNAVINCHSALPKLNVIPFQIQQLFVNIISNSIKYSKLGIDPVINIQTKVVKGKEIPGFTEDPDTRFYRISFSDNGIGFDQQYAEHIFTLFYRLHSNREYTGTGIGLAICKIIVENHKGFILAEGVPDEGSVFNVYLPA
jgi:signal transduction histidine kinase/CHASE3 domain sensor protein